MSPDYVTATLGGVLIGIAASLMLLLNGRIAGISGIAAGLFAKIDERFRANLLFVAGLMSGPALYALAFGGWPLVRLEASLPVAILAGLLVGFGSRLGSGCTSGHGVCGLSRLSARSMAAVATFMAAGMATVLLMRVLGL